MQCDLVDTGERDVSGKHKWQCSREGCLQVVWRNKKVNLQCKLSTVAELQPEQLANVKRLTSRTQEQILLTIATYCYPCPQSSHRGRQKTLHTVNCPKTCGCPSNRVRPMVEQLEAVSFKCPLGITLDKKLEEYQTAVSKL